MNPCELYITGGTALTMNEALHVVENAVIGIRGNKIESLFSQRDFRPPSGVRCLDAGNCLVMPGLVNGHTHTGMTLFRGIADDKPLMRWLTETIFPLEQKYGKPDFIYLSTLLACLEMIRSGTTTFNDMYYFEEHVARAAHESGLRAICGQVVIEIGDVEKPVQNIFDSFSRFFETVRRYPRLLPCVAPHSVYGVSDSLMKEVLRFAKSEKVPIHVHVAEVMDEVDQCRKRFGMTPVEKMLDLGMLELPLIAAHATCVTENDLKILAGHNVGIVHNPESNLKLGAKICPVVEYRKRGIPVALGTDSVASNNNLDLFSEADTAAKLQCYSVEPGALTVESVVKMLTIEGARALGLSDRIGSLEVGKRADIIAVDITHPHCVPIYNPYSHLVYSANGADVRHTVVDGVVLMEDRKILSLDEPAILAECQRRKVG
jgi:5-methylthioadenosine/S-adenosylhomocysteine deaminase